MILSSISSVSVVASSYTSHLDEPEDLFIENHEDDKNECKVIVVMDKATAGDYNLHMKVRDPSRAGGQILFILEPGYNYTYHHPTTGEVINFTVNHRIIGAATAGDIPPSILKPGMVLTDAALSFGDADNPTLEHLNENETAWDDFDWMRYAFQTANTEDEAVRLLTKIAVDELHATSIGETLFVVGPEKGYAIEADAQHYYIHEIDDIFVKSNYPEFLWEQCSYFKNRYAPSLETRFEGWVSENQTIKLGKDCSLGVKLLVVNEIGNNIIMRRSPDDGENVTINLGETQNVYNFRVKLLDINSSEHSVQISLCYKYLEWRQKVNELVNTRAGNISVLDMMFWSRLHDEDLDGLRGFCEGSATRQETVTIFKHPNDRIELMSSMWYAGIPCSSIYVPVHISAKGIFEPLKTGEVWNLTLRLLENFTHGELSSTLLEIDRVFVTENDNIERLCLKLNDTQTEQITNLLTYSDYMLQENAVKTQMILLKISNMEKSFNGTEIPESIEHILSGLRSIWKTNYSISIENMNNTIKELIKTIGSLKNSNSTAAQNLLNQLVELREEIFNILIKTANYKLSQAMVLIDLDHPLMIQGQLDYYEAFENLSEGNFEMAAQKFIKVFESSNYLLNVWPNLPKIDDGNNSNNSNNGNNGTPDNPEDNEDDQEKEPGKDGGYDPKIPDIPDNGTDKRRIIWSTVDYMILSFIILIVILIVFVNVINKKKKKY